MKYHVKIFTENRDGALEDKSFTLTIFGNRGTHIKI